MISKKNVFSILENRANIELNKQMEIKTNVQTTKQNK